MPRVITIIVMSGAMTKGSFSHMTRGMSVAIRHLSLRRTGITPLIVSSLIVVQLIVASLIVASLIVASLIVTSLVLLGKRPLGTSQQSQCTQLSSIRRHAC